MINNNSRNNQNSKFFFAYFGNLNAYFIIINCLSHINSNLRYYLMIHRSEKGQKK